MSTTAPINRREREFYRREREILTVALALSDRSDWSSVTVEQIAQAADIGKGTVYKHFASKDEIYARLVIDFYNEMLDAMADAAQGDNILEMFRNILRTALVFHLERPQYRHICPYCNRPDFRLGLPEAQQAIFATIDERFDQLSDVHIRQAIDQGLLPDEPSRNLTLGIKATFQGALSILWSGALQQCLPTQDEASAPQLLDLITDFMLAGLMHQHQYRSGAKGGNGA